MRNAELTKVTQHAKRPHNLILIFCSSIVSKTIKMFHRSPPTNNRRHCEKFAFTNYTFLQARFRNVTRSGKYEFRTSNTNSFTRLFAYPLAPRRAKKHACGRLQKEKLSI